MKQKIFILSIISGLLLVACGQKSDSKKLTEDNATYDQATYLAKIGNDPFDIEQLTSEANAFMDANNYSEARKRISLIEKYNRAKPGYCSVKGTARSNSYLIGIIPEKRIITSDDLNRDGIILMAAESLEKAWTKILELKKAGLCVNSGPCHRRIYDSTNEPTLEIPVFGDNTRIFQNESGREEFYRLGHSVGLCD